MKNHSKEIEPTVKITEDFVFKKQTALEQKLIDEIEFPAAITGIGIYIFKNLMTVWFNKLSAKNRYDDEVTQKLSSDWINYMQILEDCSVYVYLMMGTYGKDQSKSDAYAEKLNMAKRRRSAIQDAFASAVGEEAIKELADIQALDLGNFSKRGDRAPEGFVYDLGGKELISKNNSSDPVAVSGKNKGNSLFPPITK